jgi:hypothetical protein
VTDSDTESKYSFNHTVKVEDSLKNYFTTEEAIAHRIGVDFETIPSEMGGLYGYLQETLASAESDFSMAKEKILTGDELKEIENKVVRCTALINRAQRISNALNREIELIRQGNDSLLNIIKDDPSGRYSNVQISKLSFSQWVYGADKSPGDLAYTKKEVVVYEKGLTPARAKPFYVTMASLVEAFAELVPTQKSKSFKHNDGRPNIQNLATLLAERDELEGQSAEAIKNRIEAAIDIKRRFKKGEIL